MSFRAPNTLSLLLSGLLATCWAAVPFRPEYSLLSEVSNLNSINTSVFDGFSLDDVWMLSNALVITPDTDGVTFSCRDGDRYTLGISTTVEGAFQLADYLLGAPLLISSLFAPTCATLRDMTLLGDTKEMPSDWQQQAAAEPDVQYAVIKPISIEDIGKNGVTFTGAMRDYHELAGALVQTPDSPAYWLEEGNMPWEYDGETLTKRTPLAILFVAAVSFFGTTAVGTTVAGGVRATRELIAAIAR